MQQQKKRKTKNFGQKKGGDIFNRERAQTERNVPQRRLEE